MKEIQIFNNPQFGEIRVQQDSNGEPLFCLVDVAKALDLTPSKLVQRLSDDVLSKYPISDILGRTQEANFINEDGMYDAILESRKPEARKFRKWVTSEVLPSIRKQGSFTLHKTPQTFAEALLLAYKQQKEIEEKNLMLEMQAPKVEYYDDVMMSESTLTTTQVAKSLGRSGQWLNRQLKSCGLIFFQSGQWLVKSPYDRCGLHKARTSLYTRSDGTTASKSSTVWTEKGKRFIMALNDCGYKLSSAVAIMRQEQGKGGAIAV